MAEPRTALAEIEWIESAIGAEPNGAPDAHVLTVDYSISFRPPSDRTLAAQRWQGEWRRRYRRWHQLYFETPSPRVNSVVRRVFRGEPEIALALVQQRSLDTPGLELHQPLVGADGESVVRAAGDLWIPWSRPPIPVWLVVEPWWRQQALVSLRLRKSRRWRYPTRYFTAAHRVMDQLTAPT